MLNEIYNQTKTSMTKTIDSLKRDFSTLRSGKVSISILDNIGVRFIFTERVEGKMTLRRGFEVFKGERVFVCEDIITTGGSALESASCVEALGASIVGFGGLANRGFCKRVGSSLEAKPEGKLPSNIPLFALEDFVFDIYAPESCPLCKEGKTPAIKPGSRGN